MGTKLCMVMYGNVLRYLNTTFSDYTAIKRSILIETQSFSKSDKDCKAKSVNFPATLEHSLQIF